MWLSSAVGVIVALLHVHATVALLTPGCNQKATGTLRSIPKERAFVRTAQELQWEVRNQTKIIIVQQDLDMRSLLDATDASSCGVLNVTGTIAIWVRHCALHLLQCIAIHIVRNYSATAQRGCSTDTHSTSCSNVPIAVTTCACSCVCDFPPALARMVASRPCSTTASQSKPC